MDDERDLEEKLSHIDMFDLFRDVKWPISEEGKYESICTEVLYKQFKDHWRYAIEILHVLLSRTNASIHQNHFVPKIELLNDLVLLHAEKSDPIGKHLWYFAERLCVFCVRLAARPQQWLCREAPYMLRVPWYKEPLKDVSGFEAACANLEFGRDVVNTAKRAHTTLNSDVKRFVVCALSECMMWRTDEEMSYENWDKESLDENGKDPNIEQIPRVRLYRTVRSLPPLSKTTVQEWWNKAILPMMKEIWDSACSGRSLYDEHNDPFGVRRKARPDLEPKETISFKNTIRRPEDPSTQKQYWLRLCRDAFKRLATE